MQFKQSPADFSTWSCSPANGLRTCLHPEPSFIACDGFHKTFWSGKGAGNSCKSCLRAELSCGRGREPTCWSRPATQRSPHSATCPSPAVSAAPYDHKDTRGRADETQFATFQACSAVPGCLSLTHLVPADGRSPFSLPRLPGTQRLVPLHVQATLGTVHGRTSPTHGAGFWGSHEEGVRLVWSGSEQAGAILPRCALNALHHKFPGRSEARY